MKTLTFQRNIVIICVVVTIAGGCSTSNYHNRKMAAPETHLTSINLMTPEQIFNSALDTWDGQYVEFEHRILEGPPEFNQMLRSHVEDANPLAALLARALLSGRQGKAKEYNEALEQFDRMRITAERSIMQYPNSLGVMNYLNETYGDKLVDYMAVRVAKQRDMPSWCSLGILGYLRSQKLPSVTMGVIQVAIDTKSENVREAAIMTLEVINDTKLREKINFAKRQLESRSQTLPMELSRFLVK